MVNFQVQYQSHWSYPEKLQASVDYRPGYSTAIALDVMVDLFFLVMKIRDEILAPLKFVHEMQNNKIPAAMLTWPCCTYMLLVC